MFRIWTTILCLTMILVACNGIIINLKFTKLNLIDDKSSPVLPLVPDPPSFTEYSTVSSSTPSSQIPSDQFEFGEYQYDSRYDRFIHLARKRFLTPHEEFEELCLYLDRSLTLYGSQFRQYQHVFDMQKVSYQQEQEQQPTNTSVTLKQMGKKELSSGCLELMKQIEQLILSINVYQYLRPYLDRIQTDFLALKQHDAVAFYQQVKKFHQKYF